MNPQSASPHTQQEVLEPHRKKQKRHNKIKAKQNTIPDFNAVASTGPCTDEENGPAKGRGKAICK